jgi:hypothetical protein
MKDLGSGEVVQVECLTSKCEALSSNPRAIKKIELNETLKSMSFKGKHNKGIGL